MFKKRADQRTHVFQNIIG